MFEKAQSYIHEKDFKKAQEIFAEGKDFLKEGSIEYQDWIRKTQNALIQNIVKTGNELLADKNILQSQALWLGGKRLCPDSREIQEGLKKTESVLQEARDLYTKAKESYESGDTQGAKVKVEQSLNLYPDYSDALQLYTRIKDSVSSEEKYQAILANGESYRISRDWQKAITTWEKGLGLVKNDQELREKIANLKEYIQHEEEQRAEYERMQQDLKAAEENEDYAGALDILSAIRDRSWDIEVEYCEEKFKELENALDIQENSKKALDVLKEAESTLDHYQMSKTGRLLSNEIFQQPVDDFVKEELEKIQERYEITEKKTKLFVKIGIGVAALLVLSIVTWLIIMSMSESKPKEPKEIIALRDSAKQAFEDKDWEKAEKLYKELETKVSTKEKEDISGILKYVLQEQLKDLRHKAQAAVKKRKWILAKKFYQELLVKSDKKNQPEIKEYLQRIEEREIRELEKDAKYALALGQVEKAKRLYRELLSRLPKEKQRKILAKIEKIDRKEIILLTKQAKKALKKQEWLKAEKLYLALRLKVSPKKQEEIDKSLKLIAKYKDQALIREAERLIRQKKWEESRDIYTNLHSRSFGREKKRYKNRIDYIDRQLFQDLIRRSKKYAAKKKWKHLAEAISKLRQIDPDSPQIEELENLLPDIRKKNVLIALRKSAEKAMREKNWKKAKRLYRELELRALDQEKSKIRAYLLRIEEQQQRIENEHRFSVLLSRASKHVASHQWSRFKQDLREMKVIKEDISDYKKLTDVMRKNMKSICDKAKDYHRNLSSYTNKLEKSLHLYRKKYGKTSYRKPPKDAI